MSTFGNGIVVRRGASVDLIMAGETVIDCGRLDKNGKAMKANERQEYVDLVVSNLKSKGFFSKEVNDVART